MIKTASLLTLMTSSTIQAAPSYAIRHSHNFVRETGILNRLSRLICMHYSPAQQAVEPHYRQAI